MHLLLLLLFAALNLAVGVCLARYFRHGADFPDILHWALSWRDQAAGAYVAATSAAAEESITLDDILPETAVAKGLPEQQDETPAEDSPWDESPEDDSPDDDDAEPPADPASDVSSKVDEIQSCTTQDRDELAKLERDTQAGAEAKSVAAVQQCAERFKELNRDYQQQCDGNLRQLDALQAVTADDEEIRRRVMDALAQQDDDLDEALDAVEEITLDEETFEDGCESLLSQTGRLMDVTVNLDDLLPSEPAGGDEEPANNDAIPQEVVDELDCHLHDEESLPRCVAFIDLDRVDGLIHGPPAMLKAVRQSVADEVDTLQHIGGRIVETKKNGFLISFTEHLPREAIEPLERVRQSVEQTTFSAEGFDQQVTVSVAVAATVAEDTAQTLVDRLSGVLANSRSAGGNRTILCEDTSETQVVPPHLEIEPRTVAL